MHNPTRIRLSEPITGHDRIVHDVGRVLLDERTEFQHLQVVESETLGRALILDGRWQVSTSDAAIYHEPLIHGAILNFTLSNAGQLPTRILIAGGGDWMSAREALRWPTVERVVLAEIDQRVLDVCREQFPDFHARCEADDRLEVVVGDALKVIDESTAQDRFDIIIGDLSDPDDDGPSAELFTAHAFRAVRRALTRGGVYATQAGGIAPAEIRHHARTRAMLDTVFDCTMSVLAPVQIFGTPLGFCFASDALVVGKPDPARVDKLLRQAELTGLEYIDGETFSRLVYEPPYLRRAVHAAAEELRSDTAQR